MSVWLEGLADHPSCNLTWNKLSFLSCHGNTIHEIGFHFHNRISSRRYNSRNWLPFSVWLLKDPKFYFPLNQDIPQSTRGQEGNSLENVCLWETGVANLSEYFTLKEKFDGVCQVELKVSNISLIPYLFFIYYNIESNARNHVLKPLFRIQKMRIAPSKKKKSKKFKDAWNSLSGEGQLCHNAEEDCLWWTSVHLFKRLLCTWKTISPSPLRNWTSTLNWKLPASGVGRMTTINSSWRKSLLTIAGWKLLSQKHWKLGRKWRKNC